MKNKIAIITPFYPIKHRNDLFEDTKAIYYLLKDFPKDSDVLIIHLYMHGFRTAFKQLRKVLSIKGNYKHYLYKDDYGNRLIFFEYLLLFPKSIKTLSYFSKKIINILKDFSIKEQYTPEIAVVHFPTYYVDLMNKISLFPKTIAILHSFDIKNIKNRGKIKQWEDYFNNFNAIGFRSYQIKKEFENLIEFKGKKFMCLSGIPENYISHQINSSNYNVKEKINLTFAGRLDSNKNVANTILALNKIDKKIQFSFTIIGDGEEKNGIKKIAQNIGMFDRINFTGRLSREKTFESMINADIFIMVSKKETLGIVYLEAMAAGCIIIGTRGQGIDGIIIDGENGFLTDSNNINEISQTIYRVMTLSSEEQERIRKNARRTIESLNEKTVSREYFYNICSIKQEENI